MQVARLLEPRSNRNLSAKLRQIVRAVEIERVLSKDQVLSLYLELAPYGGNIEGIRAASLAYFGKEPRRLTLGEAALLVALPQSPELRRPDHFAAAARVARDRVLDRYAATGRVPADEIALAKAEPVPTARRAMPMLAPHAADRATAEAPAANEIRLTIDADLQKNLEELARERLRTLVQALGPDVSLAILAVDNATGEVLAHVGSPAYFDERRAGQVDMAQALRSPGSTLKPFIYGLGFEDGLIHPETLIDDRPERYGGYAPRNFNYSFAGTVTVRQALQQSLNMPAIAVLNRVGASRLSARARAGGRNAGAARWAGARPCHRARRRWHETLRSCDALFRHRPTGHGVAAARTPWRAAAASAPPDEPRCRVVRQQRAARLAAARERHARTHRVQDRHQLRLPRRLVGRLRRQAHDRRLGRPAGRGAGARACRPRSGGADFV